MLGRQEWNQFESTGSIQDYLCYKNVMKDAYSQKQAGDTKHGSDNHGNRDDTIRGTCRGV